MWGPVPRFGTGPSSLLLPLPAHCCLREGIHRPLYSCWDLPPGMCLSCGVGCSPSCSLPSGHRVFLCVSPALAPWQLLSCWVSRWLVTSARPPEHTSLLLSRVSYPTPLEVWASLRCSLDPRFWRRYLFHEFEGLVQHPYAVPAGLADDSASLSIPYIAGSVLRAN